MNDALINLRVPAATKARWVRESRAAGMRLTDWIVQRVGARQMEQIMQVTVNNLIKDAGGSGWLNWPEWEGAVALADAVAESITNPVNRVAFVAQSARDMLAIQPSALAGAGEFIQSLTDRAEDARPTPYGATELWGGLMQRVA